MYKISLDVYFLKHSCYKLSNLEQVLVIILAFANFYVKKPIPDSFLCQSYINNDKTNDRSVDFLNRCLLSLCITYAHSPRRFLRASKILSLKLDISTQTSAPVYKIY